MTTLSTYQHTRAPYPSFIFVQLHGHFSEFEGFLEATVTAALQERTGVLAHRVTGDEKHALREARIERPDTFV